MELKERLEIEGLKVASITKRAIAMTIDDFLISFLPSSPLFFLIYLVVFVVLCVVMIFVFAKKKQKKSAGVCKISFATRDECSSLSYYKCYNST